MPLILSRSIGVSCNLKDCALVPPSRSQNKMNVPQEGSATTSNYSSTAEAKRLRETQENVNEVVEIMQTNLQVAMEREGKLADMDERSKNLEQGCAQFKENTVKLRKKMWYRNMRMKFIIGAIIIVLLLFLIYLWFDE